MRIRHKVPSIFSLSMVDMLCCALGCIILVWLLNAKQAEDEAVERRAELDTIKSDKEESQRLLYDARTAHEKANARLQALIKERDAAKKEISDLLVRISDLEIALGSARKLLASEEGNAKELANKLKMSSERLAGLEKVAGTKEETLKTTRADLAKREAALKKILDELQTEREKLKAEHDRAEKLAKAIELARMEKDKLELILKEGKAAKEKSDALLSSKEKSLVELTRREQLLLKQLRDKEGMVEVVTAKVNRLEKDKKDLQSTIESRFAGIELVGERVLFLVDSSGSMEMIDEKTDAPKKWVEVRRTVAKLMDSLPRLSKYQLITFGPELAYPLGNKGKWLDNEKDSSAQVFKALEGTKPRGGTNMYIALEAAFSYRALGLDTVYLLSDGLPNQGEGLTKTQAKTLNDIDRGMVLGRYVRTMLNTTWNRSIAGQPKVKIHTIGFFYESPDLGSFLWALARENEGSFVGMSRP
jgi:hypothetical protein